MKKVYMYMVYRVKSVFNLCHHFTAFLFLHYMNSIQKRVEYKENILTAWSKFDKQNIKT